MDRVSLSDFWLSDVFGCRQMLESFFVSALAPTSSQPKQDEDKKASKPVDKKKSKDDKSASANSTGLFGRLLGKMGLSGTAKAHLPDDKDQSIVWCEKTKVTLMRFKILVTLSLSCESSFTSPLFVVLRTQCIYKRSFDTCLTHNTAL